MNYQGYVIARERLAKSWSQEGLCKGICTVSYLSKIENGKADPSEQILCLLFERLGLLYQPALEYIPAELRARVNAFNNVLITAGASLFSLLIGFLGEVVDYRWCVTIGGAIAMLASLYLIWGRKKDVRKIYETEEQG